MLENAPCHMHTTEKSVHQESSHVTQKRFSHSAVSKMWDISSTLPKKALIITLKRTQGRTSHMADDPLPW